MQNHISYILTADIGGVVKHHDSTVMDDSKGAYIEFLSAEDFYNTLPFLLDCEVVATVIHEKDIAIAEAIESEYGFR